MNPAVALTEDTLAEQPALKWFRELGYEVAFGPDISPGGLRPERESFSDVVLRLRSALEKLNPHLPQAEGERRGDFARVFDFDNPANNDFMVVNPFTVIEGEHNR
jgi:type I site-specific restriction-modification system R (restriction) subunit